MALRDRANDPEFARCPVCSYLMIVNNPKRPIGLICPKCKTSVIVSEGRDGPIAEESRSKGPLELECPRCGEHLVIISKERPLRVKCPKCGVEGLIKGYDQMFTERSSPAIGKWLQGPHGQKVVKCAGCGERIVIETDIRPLVVTCPRCGKSGRISK